MTIRTGLAACAVAFALTACADPPPSNYRPPELGVPTTAAEVTGIYRTIHQGLLQLRGNGDLNLVIPKHIGATSGTFTLENGAATVRTDNCGDQVGRYTIEVLAGSGIGRSTITFETVDDPCAVRQKYLTIDPWVYADS